MLKYILISLLVLAVIWACTNNTRPADTTANAAEPKTEVATPKVDRAEAEQLVAEYDFIVAASPNGDTLTVAPFSFTLDLTAEAEEKLRDREESIIVAAYLTGLPKDKQNESFLKEGTQYLASPEIEVMEEREVTFEGVKIARADFAGLVDRDFTVTINIYSGRRSYQNNILDGEVPVESISDMVKEKRILRVELL
ncbi:MAG: hypothetical protein AAGJ82_02905 [Bacteroidota bacterium]